ncbi:Stomatin [uncultured archaeon]|nr:Stomatin [uncultured archaeon]
METLETVVFAFAALFVIVISLALIAAGLRTYREYERGVRFRLGRFNKVIGPGITFSIPYIDSTVAVDMRSKVVSLPNLRALTRGKNTVFVDAAVRYRISSPQLVVTKVADARESLKAVSESAIRGKIGELPFDALVEKREFIAARLRETVSGEAEKWGLVIEGVEISDVTPSERMMQYLRLRAGAQINKRAENIRKPRARKTRGRKR